MVMINSLIIQGWALKPGQAFRCLLDWPDEDRCPQRPTHPPCSFAHKTTAPVVGKKKRSQKAVRCEFHGWNPVNFSLIKSPWVSWSIFQVTAYWKWPRLGGRGGGGGGMIGSGGSNLSDIFLPFLKVFPSSHVDLRFLGFRFLQFPAYHYYRLQCLALHFPFSQEVLSVNSRLLI